MHEYIAQIRDDMLLFDSGTSEFSLLLSLYIIIIILASAGSLLVIIVIICSNHLRTTSNYYIVNLAVSDLLLVLIACPATITHVSSSHWPLSPIPSLCQLATFLPLLFSFASTFSICLIALDRYQLIVHTHNSHYKTVNAMSSMLGCWVLASLIAAPILPNTRLEIHKLSPKISSLLGIKERAYCMEDWGYQHGRLCYSLCVLSKSSENISNDFTLVWFYILSKFLFSS